MWMKTKRGSFFLTAALIATLAFSLIVSSCQGAATPTQTPPPVSTPSPPSSELPLSSIADVVAKVKPSVVAIEVEVITYDIFNRPVEQRGAGSGWIISEDGYVVTNNHVVEGAQTVTVTLSDGSTFTAESVRTDPLNDLAVVKIGASNLPAVSTGDSSGLRVGDQVVAIGNALGQGISATAGIVSQLGVKIAVSAGQELYGLIQTDAAINPGNSGGPLVNLAGEVIGITNIKIAELGVEGMGYAISINEAKPIIEQLITVGRIVRPWLGIGGYSVDAALAKTYNLPVDKGVLVTSVAPNSPATQAGLQLGDIITAINDEEIDDLSGFESTLTSHKIGETVEITYWRGNKSYQTQATLAESPPTGS